jgi:hypothetical protein
MKVIACIEDPVVIVTTDGLMPRRPWMAGSGREDPESPEGKR